MSSPKSFRGRVVEAASPIKPVVSAKKAAASFQITPRNTKSPSTPRASSSKSSRKTPTTRASSLQVEDDDDDEDEFIDPCAPFSEDEDLPQHISDSRRLAKLFQARLEETAKASRSPNRTASSPSRSAGAGRTQAAKISEPVHRIIKAAEYKPKSVRVPRHPWTTEEENALREGVRRYGVGNWARIRDDPGFPFHLNPQIRDNVALKDKWRNLVSYKEYSALPIRQYTILDKYHQPYLTRTGNPICYRNRWPRDAALKGATKDEFYDGDPNKTTTIIYVKELGNEREESKVVHVYYAQRQRIANDGSLPRFGRHRMRWEASVEKKREEAMQEF